MKVKIKQSWYLREHQTIRISVIMIRILFTQSVQISLTFCRVHPSDGNNHRLISSASKLIICDLRKMKTRNVWLARNQIANSRGKSNIWLISIRSLHLCATVKGVFMAESNWTWLGNSVLILRLAYRFSSTSMCELKTIPTHAHTHTRSQFWNKCAICAKTTAECPP